MEASSAKASGTGDVTTTASLQDLTGSTLSLEAGTYVVHGVYDVEVNNSGNDKLFEGHLDVGGSDQNDIALLLATGFADADRVTVSQSWRIVLASTTTVKLRALHSGGATGDFDVKGANTTITAYRAGGGSFGAWAAFTPTWTASTTNPTIGNGTLLGRYLIEGKRMHFSIYIKFGSTTTAGSGTYTIGNLPGTSKSSGMDQQIAPLHIQDSGTTNFHGLYRILAGGTSGLMSVADVGNPRDVTHAVPQTWATGDFMSITGTIEID